MKKTRKDVSQDSPVLLKVSRSSPKRSHIEIPAEHREDFKPSDHVWVEKVVYFVTSKSEEIKMKKVGSLFSISE